MEVTPAGPVLIKIPGWRRISGLVLNSDGAPAEGVEVSLRDYQPERPFEATVHTRPDGTFEFRRVAPAQYRLTCREDSHARYVREHVDTREIDLNIDSIQLRPAASLEGAVRDRLGEPVVGAQVRACDSFNTTLCAESRSNEDGSFGIKGLSPGYLDISISTGGVEVWSRERLEIVDDRTDIGEITVETRLAAIRGRLLTGVGSGAPGREVRVVSRVAEGTRERVSTTVTDAEGRFMFSGLVPGTAVVFAGRPSARLREIRRLTLFAGLTAEIESVESGVRLKGRLVGADIEMAAEIFQEQAIASSGTTPYSRSVHVAAQGDFDLGEVAPGRSRLVLRSLDGRTAFFESLDIPEGSDFWAEIGVSTIRGQIVDSVGRGVSGASVTSAPADQDFPPEAVALSDLDGSFALLGRPGSRRLRVGSSQGSGEAVISIPSGNSATITVDARFEAAARALESSGHLADDAIVYLTDNGLLTDVRRDAFGVFRGRASTNAVFVARRSGFWGAMAARADALVDIRLQPCRLVTIRVTRANGDAGDGVHLGVSTAGGIRLPPMLFRGVTDTRGEVTIEAPHDDIELVLLGVPGGGMWRVPRTTNVTTVVIEDPAL